MTRYYFNFSLYSTLLIFIATTSCQLINRSQHSSNSNLEAASAIEAFKENYSPVSNKNIQRYLGRMSEKLILKTSLTVTLPKILILTSDQVFAFSTHNNEIILSTELLNNLENESQLAFILAHELAHHILKHTNNLSLSQKQTFEFNKSAELEADKLGIKLIISSGYDARQALLALAQLYQVEDMSVDDSTHPEFSERIFALQSEIANNQWTTGIFRNEREFVKFKGELERRL